MEFAFRPMLVAVAAYALGIATELTGAQENSSSFLKATKTASKDPDLIRFYSFSNPSNASEAEEIVFNGTKSLLPPSFDCTKVSKILVHGFTGQERNGFPGNVKIEYLKKLPATGYNIITVDYGPLATCPDPTSYLCYPDAALKAVKIAGRRIGEFLASLRDTCGPQYLNLVHVIGHSLGSHVSGYAGHTVKKSTGSQIGRLTGLDPAGPLFLKGAPRSGPRMMKASDANFTDIYVTGAGFKGTSCTVGHLNLFVNGGFISQPGCGLAADFKSIGGCSHAKSTEYYANSIAYGDPASNSSASIQACKMLSVQCLAAAPVLFSRDGCDQMIVYGEYLKPGSAVGTYCVGYPPPRTCATGRSGRWPFFNIG